MLEAAAAHELLGQRPEHLVDDERAVTRVRRDVRVVVRVEPEVQRVGHEAADRRADVDLEVLGVVPHERPHPVAILEPELPQRGHEPLRARNAVRVRVAMPALVRQAARDLAVAVEIIGAAKIAGTFSS